MVERLPSLCGAACQQRCWETGRSPGWSWTGTWQHSRQRCLGPQCIAGKCGTWSCWVRWDGVNEVAAYYIKRCPLFSTLCHSSLYDRNGNEFILFANHDGTLNSFLTFFFNGCTITSEVTQTITLSGHPGCLAFCVGFFILFCKFFTTYTDL